MRSSLNYLLLALCNGQCFRVLVKCCCCGLPLSFLWCVVVPPPLVMIVCFFLLRAFAFLLSDWCLLPAFALLGCVPVFVGYFSLLLDWVCVCPDVRCLLLATPYLRAGKAVTNTH